jgi:hypothetical protein
MVTTPAGTGLARAEVPLAGALEAALSRTAPR